MAVIKADSSLVLEHLLLHLIDMGVMDSLGWTLLRHDRSLGRIGLTYTETVACYMIYPR